MTAWEILNKLNSHYQSRYYDNPNNNTNCVPTADLKELDDLWIYLVENIPMPVEVKFRSGTYVYLCQPGIKDLWGYWLLLNNPLLQDRIEVIQKTNNEVLNHLYSNNKTDPQTPDG